MKNFFLIAVSIFSICMAPVAVSHHATTATFNDEVLITIEGVVTDFNFRNPHMLISTDVTNEDGSVTQWVSEGAAATLVRKAGWTRDTIKPGDLVRITGESTRDGSPQTGIDSVEFLDPVTREVTSTIRPGDAIQRSITEVAESIPLHLEDGRPNLTSAWSRHGLPRTVGNRQQLHFTEAGATAQEGYDSVNDPQIFCDMPGLARQLSTPHPTRITQHDDRVVLEYEDTHGKREIYFDDRQFLGVNTRYGDSIARYDGDKLIIETTNLLSNVMSSIGNRLSDETVITETYYRDDRPEYGPVLAHNIVISDPKYLTQNAGYNGIRIAQTNYEFTEFDCRTPLRERYEVNQAMNIFSLVQDTESVDSAGQQCMAAAEKIGQSEKNWKAHADSLANIAASLAGEGPWYNARGELLGIDLDELRALSASNFSDQLGKPLAEGSIVHCISN